MKSTIEWCEQEIKKVEEDAFVYGTGFLLTVHRKWWNPIRFIKGNLKQKRLDPFSVFIKGGER